MVEQFVVRKNCAGGWKRAKGHGDSITPEVREQGSITVALFLWKSPKAFATGEVFKRRKDWSGQFFAW
jgi:hypothetical protein